MKHVAQQEVSTSHLIMSKKAVNRSFNMENNRLNIVGDCKTIKNLKEYGSL